MAIIGVIGGSGLYQIGHENRGEKITVDTPFGPPSAPLLRCQLKENTLLFIPRHGEGHTISPSELNSRANIFALKKLGAEMVISVSAVGSMREEIEPGHFVLPEQYIDRTDGRRPRSFFGEGVVAHALFADPTCDALRSHLFDLCQGLGIRVYRGGTYVCVEGPQFSTRAESHLFRSWKLGSHSVSVIGMTALPEARLAREAGLCYQTVAMVTDYDCWNEKHGDVSVEAILRVLRENADTSRRLITALLESPRSTCRSHCRTLMKQAVLTPQELWPVDRRETLEIVLR